MLVELIGCSFLVDTIVLRGQDLYVILGMNWLVQHEAIIDTKQQTIYIGSTHKGNKLLIHLFPLVKTIG